MTMTDLKLVEQASQGDRDAFQRLLERHYDTIYRFAHRFAGNAHDAEDIAQDVCLKLVDALGTFRGNARFSTWLYRVVLNAARDFARKGTTRAAAHQVYGEVRELDRADAVENQARASWLGEALDALDPGLRETALLVVAEELSHAQAAEILDCAETTVSWRMGEVRKKLKSLAEMVHDR